MGNEVAVSNFRSLDDGYAAPNCTVTGGARSSLFHPAGYSLWQLRADVAPGTQITWGDHHGDEALYVIDGCLVVDDEECSRGGAVVIEAGVAATVRAVTDSRVVHSGTVEALPPSDGPFGAPATEGRGVHVFPAVDPSRQLRAAGRPLASAFFLDGSCPTCRIAYFVIDGSDATDGYVGRSHTHTRDEIIYMIDGEIRLGTTVVEPGESIAVPADHRYGFRANGPFRFLNYRDDAASATFKPGSTPVFETVAALTSSGVLEAS